MPDKNVLVIGGGVAGLTTAVTLADLGCRVALIEKEADLGGVAGRFVCKAADECVKCGACSIIEKKAAATCHPNITIHTRTQLAAVSGRGAFQVILQKELEAPRTESFDAIVLATGFKPFDPIDKPYGYGRFADVVTNLELEDIIRRHGLAARPSDGGVVENIAFIQCVGSRDASLNHLWCSEICCGASLRMANLIQTKRPETKISVFYIDIQNFGKDFETFYNRMQDRVRLVRAIPGDVMPAGERLKLNYYLSEEGQSQEEVFDMVVLAVGITPRKDADALLDCVGYASPKAVFYCGEELKEIAGVFAVGTATGPKSIADSIADAGRTAMDVGAYLKTIA